MDTIDMIYSELKLAREEIRAIKDDLVDFKIKVIIYAAGVAVLSGGATAKMLSVLA